MKIGFIGTGNMGTILIEALLESEAVKPSQLYLFNRTKEKALRIQQKFETIHVVDEVDVISKYCDCIFVCVKPHQIPEVLEAIKNNLIQEQCIVSITSPVTVEELELLVPCQVARIIPSILNRALTGASLMTFGDRLSDVWKRTLTEVFSHISKPIEMEENITRISSDIVSCGPAFFSYLAERMMEAAVKKSNITKEEALFLTTEMLIGLGELLKQKHYTLPTLIEKVCVKNGITGEGISVLESHLDGVFEEMFTKTNDKFLLDKKLLQGHFNG